MRRGERREGRVVEVKCRREGAREREREKGRCTSCDRPTCVVCCRRRRRPATFAPSPLLLCTKSANNVSRLRERFRERGVSRDARRLCFNVARCEEVSGVGIGRNTKEYEGKVKRSKHPRCFRLETEMIFTGRSVDALDEVRGTGGAADIQAEGRRDIKAVAIAAGWFSSLRRPGKKKKSHYQKQQAKSAWDLSDLTLVSPPAGLRFRVVQFPRDLPRSRIVGKFLFPRGV